MTRKIIIKNCGECPFVDERSNKAFCERHGRMIVERLMEVINLEQYAIPTWCRLEKDEQQ